MAQTRRTADSTSPNAAKPGDAVAKDTTAALQIAAFGDSLMWGQGLKRDDRFSHLFTTGLAMQTNKTCQLVFDESRSGAKIRARGNDRQHFVDTYPSLLSGRTRREAFLKGEDESPATALYGEIPATFPSVFGQVDLMSDALGDKITAALVDGGVNDVEIQEIVDPRAASGEFIARFDGDIRTVAYDDVMDLLGRVRRKCPDAVIMYFGFFEALSYLSDTEQMRSFLKREYDNDVEWWFNEHIFQAVNVDALIAEAIVRAVWFQGRWQYWTTKAVDDANHDEALRGRGIVFVPSGFRGENAVFASSPWLWDDAFHPTQDDARDTRINRIPRTRQMNDMVKLRNTIVLPGGSNPTNKKRAATLLKAVDGSVPLQAALRKFVAGAHGGEVFVALTAELARMRRALIASLSHPNRAGAKSYAAIALERWKLLDERKAQARKEALQPNVPSIGRETITQVLQRCKLRGDGPVVADLGRLDIDSFRLRITTGDNSDARFLPDVWLIAVSRDAAGNTTQRRYMVNFKYQSLQIPNSNSVIISKLYPQFEPGTTHRFTIATEGALRLSEIIGTALVVGPDKYAGKKLKGYGLEWIPTNVQLEVNGHPVQEISVQGIVYRPGNHLDLLWPAPHPGFVPPKLDTVELKPVKPLGLNVHKPATVVTPAKPARGKPKKSGAKPNNRADAARGSVG